MQVRKQQLELDMEQQEEKGMTEDEIKLDGFTVSMDMSLSKLRELVMDGEAWHAAVHGVTKSWTRLSDWTELIYLRLVLLPGKFHGWRSLVYCSPWGRTESDTTERFHFHILEKEMAAHSSVLAWRIPEMAEPGGLPSMGSHRVGHDWSDLAAAAAACYLLGQDETGKTTVREATM